MSIHPSSKDPILSEILKGARIWHLPAGDDHDNGPVAETCPTIAERALAVHSDEASLTHACLILDFQKVTDSKSTLQTVQMHRGKVLPCGWLGACKNVGDRLEQW